MGNDLEIEFIEEEDGEHWYRITLNEYLNISYHPNSSRSFVLSANPLGAGLDVSLHIESKIIEKISQFHQEMLSK